MNFFPTWTRAYQLRTFQVDDFSKYFFNPIYAVFKQHSSYQFSVQQKVLKMFEPSSIRMNVSAYKKLSWSVHLENKAWNALNM